MAGIDEVWIQQHADFTSGVTIDGTTQEIDALPTATIYPFKTAKNVSSWTEETSTANGMMLHTQTVTLVFQKMSSAKRLRLELLAQNRSLVIFVKDKNGKIWMVGRQNGAELTTNAAGSGTAASDLNGYTVTFVAEEPVAAEALEAYTSSPFDNFTTITIGSSNNG